MIPEKCFTKRAPKYLQFDELIPFVAWLPNLRARNKPKKTMKVIARAASFELLTFCSKRTKCGGKCQQRSRQRGF